MAGLVAFFFSSFVWAEVSIQVYGINNGKIGSIHACSRLGGKDQSPEIVITTIPKNAKFLTIIVDDPDARPVAGKTWVHWNVFNIPVTGSTMTFAAGSKPSGTVGKILQVQVVIKECVHQMVGIHTGLLFSPKTKRLKSNQDSQLKV